MNFTNIHKMYVDIYTCLLYDHIVTFRHLIELIHLLIS